MTKQKIKARQQLLDLLNLLYQWAATIFMWVAITSNFSHIQWYIAQHAVKEDWTTWAMAFVVEAGLGLSVHQAISSLRGALLSVGRSTTKEDRRFNWVVLPIFVVSGGALGAFSAWCNAAFFGGDWVLGTIAPILTAGFALLEAGKELLSTKRSSRSKTRTMTETAIGQEMTIVSSVVPVVPPLDNKQDRLSWLRDNWPVNGKTVSDLADTWQVTLRTVSRYLSELAKERDDVHV